MSPSEQETEEGIQHEPLQTLFVLIDLDRQHFARVVMTFRSYARSAVSIVFYCYSKNSFRSAIFEQ